MRNMILLFPLLLLLLVSGSGAALDPNSPQRTYCDDEETRRDWEARAGNSPDDRELQTLHAFWLGLCVKIQRHSFATEEARDIFERRETFVERWRADKVGREQSRTGEGAMRERDIALREIARRMAAEEATIPGLDTTFSIGTILSCSDCGEGLYKVTTRATRVDLVLDDGTILSKR